MPAAIQALLKQFGSFHKGKTQQHSTAIKHFASGTIESEAKLKAVMRELFWSIECIDSKADCNFICPEDLVQTMANIIDQMKVAGDCPSLDFTFFGLDFSQLLFVLLEW